MPADCPPTRATYRPTAIVGGDEMGEAIRAIDAVMRETSLFAAAGLLIGGLDDLLVDLLFLFRRWLGSGTAARRIADLPVPVAPARFAVFVAAWDEAAVIGQMLATATRAAGSRRLPDLRRALPERPAARSTPRRASPNAIPGSSWSSGAGRGPRPRRIASIHYGRRCGATMHAPAERRPRSCCTMRRMWSTATS